MPVDLSGSFRKAIQENLAEAKKAQESGNIERAVVHYTQVASVYRSWANETDVGAIKRQHLSNADAYEQYANRLKSGRVAAPASAGALLERGDEDEGGLESQVGHLLERSSVTWADIGGLEDTKREIKVAYGLSLVKMPPGVSLDGWRAILLYGPPGTGKTMLAAAASNGLDAKFFNVPLSSILSKYFGETSRLVAALFKVARNASPSVVFLDEFETIATQRTGEESGAERRTLSTFLTELDGLKTKNDPRYLMTIASTNLPRLLDKAILSRFQRKILIPLPDPEARASILKVHLERFGITSYVPLNTVAAGTEWFSGRELDGLVRDAVNRMVGAENPDLAALVDRGQETLRNHVLKVRPLSRDDWTRACDNIKPQMNKANYQEYLDFRKEQM